jgi:hypothetical protein
MIDVRRQAHCQNVTHLATRPGEAQKHYWPGGTCGYQRLPTRCQTAEGAESHAKSWHQELA